MQGHTDEEVNVTSATNSTREERARKRAKSYTDVMWHVAVFVIINGFFWILDVTTGGGVTWSFWITLFWGLALAFHIAAYFVGERGDRKYQQMLNAETDTSNRRSGA